MIITSDHGWRDAAAPREQLSHVPLLVRLARQPARANDDKPVEAEDVIAGVVLGTERGTLQRSVLESETPSTR